ncbi:coagulation factor 5/8 type domain-containing protein [Actinacidiphila sp. ITFR-21]|uniref:coagulation factor 5/8 type domain-containing protein n=1 Tax=Actinacidiphila sp. ITFR-21 TaxID=3075199 RepID=UPI00288C198F|nr:coagulation factor 5/8 type domain-containing protein [Streptomyces sp. ITFR-21]WNI19395.1 coagulation factor 5/8 type domain-containing protein [Streptomyces sp. ITFR-21]
MSSFRAADTETPEPQRRPEPKPAAGTGLSRRSFVTAAALATAAPVAGATTASAHGSGRHGHPRPPAEPDFGPNVRIFGPDTPTADIQAALDAAALEQVPAEFGTGRYAFFFKPGTYDVDAQLGYYTSVAGLGLHPDDVTINGAVRVEGQDQPGGGDSALTNFWRSAENLAVVPTGGVNWWAVSQAAPLRRVHIRGQLFLFPRKGGYSSGGYIADSVVDEQALNASQQQWLTRDSTVGSWSNGVWNQVFAGVEGAPAQSFPSPPYTTLPTSPLSREKPFLYVDGHGGYRVFLPALRHDGVGTTWKGGATPGSSVPIDRFFVAKPGDSVRTINKALSQGKHLLLTPGIYKLTDTIKVKWAGTVVLGLGYATLTPVHGTVPLTVDDSRGVRIAGLLFDAGPVNSRVLLEIGGRRGGRTDPRDPASVQDVFFRIGGAGAGKATTALIVNSDNVLLDHIWAWRADHGAGVGWTVNTSETGVVVNGDNVLATGLFVEHFQKYNVIWNGDKGRTIMFQNELPYDPPNQAAYRHHGVNGYAAYKVADSVKHHEGWGLGSYCFFNVDPTIHNAHGFEAPVRPGVKFHDLLTVSLNGDGVIDHVINDFGDAAQGTATVPVNVVSYPEG